MYLFCATMSLIELAAEVVLVLSNYPGNDGVWQSLAPLSGIIALLGCRNSQTAVFAHGNQP
jgi:hypothetical protein